MDDGRSRSTTTPRRGGAARGRGARRRGRARGATGGGARGGALRRRPAARGRRGGGLARPGGAHRRGQRRSSCCCCSRSFEELESATLSVLAPDLRDAFGVSNGVIVFLAVGVRRVPRARRAADGLARRPLPASTDHRLGEPRVRGLRRARAARSPTRSSCSGRGSASASRSRTRSRCTGR